MVILLFSGVFIDEFGGKPYNCCKVLKRPEAIG